MNGSQNIFVLIFLPFDLQYDYRASIGKILICYNMKKLKKGNLKNIWIIWTETLQWCIRYE